MHTITDPAELVHYWGCCFVPTMGALHDGHLSLIREAKRQGSPVLVSIFVNPEQFAPDEDFESYPRNLEQDLRDALGAGADVIFAPEVETIYPNQTLKIDLPHAATAPKLEDAFRPTHFRGVCLVIARLFDLIQPSVAVFGEKDYQQLLVIQQMVKSNTNRWNDLQIIGTPIIRDDDGLALSSRNEYLSTDDRCQALSIHRALREPTEQKMFDMLEVNGLEIEYAVIRDESTLLEPQRGKSLRALIAARVGKVRLIDNCEVEQNR